MQLEKWNSTNDFERQVSPCSVRLLGPFTVQNLAFIMPYVLSWAFQVTLMIKKLPANAGDLGSVPGSGRSPGGGHGNPLQCSCLENPMDRGAWRATVHGVAKSWA